jgi:protein SCO1
MMKTKKNKVFFVLAICLFAFSCKEKAKIGFTGPFDVVNGDTVHFEIPAFEFYNQDSVLFTNKNLKNKIYVMSFFFSSCPSMCPMITKNLTKVHEKFKDNPAIQIASITIDPNYDNCKKLKLYSNGFEIDNARWNFLRNTEEYTHEFIQKKLYQSVVKDPNAPGGFDHSSKVLLVDNQGRLRKFYDGTEVEKIDELIADIEVLVAE